jgi:putative ABC transport system ATP-binding protein
MINLSHVGKVYAGSGFEVTALRDISLRVPAAQFACVVGKSGSGKSSLLKILGLLDFSHTGEYVFDGFRPRGAREAQVALARKRIGFVFQDFQLIGRFTVLKNLQIASAVRTGAPQNQEIAECLERVELEDKAANFPHELSGGQKQRVAVARAILGKPRLIIADEPTGSLDSATARQVIALLKQAQRDLRCSLVLVTHDMEIAEEADRVIELVGGEITSDLLH